LLPAAFPAVFRQPSPSVFPNRFIQMTTPAPVPPLSVSDDYAQQQEIPRLCVHAALLLLQYGAESTLIDQIAVRLGRALGMDSVECALTPNAIVITTRRTNQCITTTRKNFDKGINMSVITAVQHIVLDAEDGLYSVQEVRERLVKELDWQGPVYCISAISGQGCRELCYAIWDYLESLRPPEDVDPDVRFDRENAAEVVNGETAAAEASGQQTEEGPAS